MKTTITAMVIAGALGLGALLAPTPADARDRRSSSVSVYVDLGDVSVGYREDRRRYHRGNRYHRNYYRRHRHSYYRDHYYQRPYRHARRHWRRHRDWDDD